MNTNQPAPKKGKLGLILLIIGIVVVFLVGGAFAYLKFIAPHSANGNVLTRATLNPNCKYNDPDLCKFINGWKDVKYYTYTANETMSDGKKGQFILKMAGTDHTQMVASESGTENYNTISIADTTYTKDYSDNKWWKYTAKVDTATEKTQEEDKLNFDDPAAEDKTTYKKIGTEACDKLTCFKYQVIDPANTDSTEYIYFDNKDYQLRKTRSEMKDGSVIEATIDYGKISISVPSPVKEGNPYQGTVPTTPTSTESTSIPTTTVTPDATTVPDATTDIPTDTSGTDTTGL